MDKFLLSILTLIQFATEIAHSERTNVIFKAQIGHSLENKILVCKALN